MYTKPIALEQPFLSPEGVDEQVKHTVNLFVTLTQGGRYRLYIATSDTNAMPIPAVFDSLAEAVLELGRIAVIHGGMIVNPKMTMDIVSRIIDRPTPP